MSNKSKAKVPLKSLAEIRRNQPRVTYEQAMLQHQRMMKASPKGSNERRVKKAA